ncbi:MAG: phosphoribosylformylglycinamidine synthase subunit PurS [Alphaproteobacteria bacterium]|jgi:phosphoribosylformylglycinamidine synthase
MRARVSIRLRPDVLDPQGKAIGQALVTLGFSSVNNVRQGKLIELDVEASDVGSAEQQVQAMCEKLLANPVIEDYDIEIIA